jgi:hypothetical protein
VRQYQLALEKKWVTQDCWFRIFSTLFGMTVTDAWRALKYSVPQNSPHKHMTIRDFVDILAGDILKMELDRRRSCDRGVVLPLIVREHTESATSIMSNGEIQRQESAEVSAVTDNSAWRQPKLLVIDTIQATTTAKSKKRRKRERCLECSLVGVRNLTSYYCDLCTHPTSVGGKYYVCGINQRDCFEMHTCKKHKACGVNI